MNKFGMSWQPLVPHFACRMGWMSLVKVTLGAALLPPLPPLPVPPASISSPLQASEATTARQPNTPHTDLFMLFLSPNRPSAQVTLVPLPTSLSVTAGSTAPPSARSNPAPPG